ncbi:MAG: Thymidylate kinase [Firmicutes bacterium ADurb.Bin193]|nr:MAG: Thymidylate kinase [Firmicutes bacterium ADurb.Bin193]
MLIVIEGVDGSGKQTHTDKICTRLLKAGKKVKKIRFPDYESPSAALVKMYLAGRFGSRPEDVSAYVASSFYAVDRIASYLSDWKKDYESGKIILADRYTTSNAVHQACKLEDIERERYLSWLFDYEYNILKLPKPDLVIFLDMPPHIGLKLIGNRDNKITGEAEKDIHERDPKHLEASYNTALEVAREYGWSVVRCSSDNSVRSIDDISDEIYSLILGLEV